MNLATLENGTKCFVEVRAHQRLAARVYRGEVQEQQEYDRTVRVRTEAAKEIHHRWLGMSFKWDTGLGYCCKFARLIVPDASEFAEWEAKARRSEDGFVDQFPESLTPTQQTK